MPQCTHVGNVGNHTHVVCVNFYFCSDGLITVRMGAQSSKEKQKGEGKSETIKEKDEGKGKSKNKKKSIQHSEPGRETC